MTTKTTTGTTRIDRFGTPWCTQCWHKMIVEGDDAPRCSHCDAQPAPDPGEWRVFQYDRKRVLNAEGLLIADAQTEEQAARIVADHNAALENDLNKLESEVVQTAIAYHCRRDDGDAKFLFHEACTTLIEARYQSTKQASAAAVDEREG